MILVVGSTGMVGGETCRRLIGEGETVRALVRPSSDPAKVAALREVGAEVVVGDLRDRSTLDAACRGIRTVACTVSAMPHAYEAGVNDIRTTDLLGVLDLISAAGNAGVRRFVYLSFSGNLNTPCPLADAKRTVEARLRGGMLEYTILRPSCFMEVWLSPAVGFDPLAATATIYGDGTQPISWISASDVAEFMARAAVSPTPSNEIIELGGPAALSPLDVIEIFQRVGGRPFTVQHVPLDALETQRLTATDPMQESFAALMCSYARGDSISMHQALEAFPMTLTSVERYAERVLGRVPAGIA